VRILLVNQFYPPDIAPTGQALHGLARALVDGGHEVHVVCSRRSYDAGRDYPARENMDGVQIHRLPALGFGRESLLGALGGYASFHALLALKILAALPRPDLTLALTTPPYVGLVTAACGRVSGTAQAHWVMDVYPDVIAAHGLMHPRGLAYRVLSAITHRQLRSADLVLAIGPFMARRLDAYRGAGRTEWVPLWGETSSQEIDQDAVERLRRERGWKPGDLVLMYSGNMGLGHRFGEFLQAADHLGVTGPVWAFAGSGKRRGEIESFAATHSRARIQLLPYVPHESLAISLSSADVQLVSLSRPWQGLIVPSKIQGIFSVGRPVIFVGPRQNEVATWIEESGAGWIVEEDDVTCLLAAVQQACDPVERERRGSAALAYARVHFDRRRNCEQIASLIERCVGGRASCK
jgi:colanic acid biosynthesis glycosyl transferase WcaI